MNCSFCHGTKRAPRFMSYDEFRQVCDSLVGVTEYIYFHILGEPTMHPDLPLFLDYAISLGFKTAITTNGTLLDKVGKSLIEHSVYKVNVSLHSFEGENKQDADKYLTSVLDFADKASTSGTLTILRLWNRGFDGGRNKRILDKISARFGGFAKTSERGVRVRDKLHIEYGDRFEWPSSEREELGSRVFCHGMGDHFGILSDGTVVPCCLDAEGDIPLGNIFKDKLADCIGSERALKIKEGFKNKRAVEDLCKKCPYARRFKV